MTALTYTGDTPNGPNPLGLADLPHEILLLILSSLPTAADVSHLGLTCRRLRRLVTSEGWRAFEDNNKMEVEEEEEEEEGDTAGKK
ncbi:hypothetical protein N0V85_004150 [Neurospora sp. IMI 360204]|nr:hypothetical protein N0V85_004150 [Neurospora sp. IMI 360204]